MKIGAKLDQIHLQARKNRWLHYFAIFCRIALAIGFIPPGMQKILGERFTTLAVNQPMGHFLEAFYHTGYYYPFVGFMQVTAGILLLIPRTVTLAAFIYLPIILNICILSFALRFEGSIVSSPLMLLAVLFLLCWDYHKFKYIFPFHHALSKSQLPQQHELTYKFPIRFFAGVFASILIVITSTQVLYKIMPRNNISDCNKQCATKKNPEACLNFCACIHTEGKLLDACLEEYNKAIELKPEGLKFE